MIEKTKPAPGKTKSEGQLPGKKTFREKQLKRYGNELKNCHSKKKATTNQQTGKAKAAQEIIPTRPLYYIYIIEVSASS